MASIISAEGRWGSWPSHCLRLFETRVYTSDSGVVPGMRREQAPYKFIGFGAMAVTKPYKFIGFGAMAVTKPSRCGDRDQETRTSLHGFGPKIGSPGPRSGPRTTDVGPESV